MLNLILGIFCSSAISIVMRLSDKRVKNNFVMLAGNYAVCGLLSFLFVWLEGGSSAFTVSDSATASDWTLTIIIGLINGVFYLVTLLLLQISIKKNGMVLSSTFMKLGILVPLILSVVLGWDQPTVLQFIGCGLAILAIIIINGEKSPESADAPTADNDKRIENTESEKAKTISSGLFLIILLIGFGVSDSFANVIDKVGAPSLKNIYLLILFVTAFSMAVLGVIVKKQHFNIKDLLWGVLLGVPNFFSSRFFLNALGDLPSIVVYPVFNIAALLLISVVGFIFFKERCSKRKMIGILIIIVAILMLNLR